MKMNYYSESNYEIFHGTEDGAGLDLPFYDKDIEEVTLMPGQRTMLKTGIYLEIPQGYYGELDSRSSTSKLNLLLMCRTIDADYRGNIRLVFINVGTEPITVHRGDYLGQIIIQKYEKMKLTKLKSKKDLSQTVRGVESFGSTGNAKHNTNEEDVNHG